MRLFVRDMKKVQQDEFINRPDQGDPEGRAEGIDQEARQGRRLSESRRLRRRAVGINFRVGVDQRFHRRELKTGRDAAATTGQNRLVLDNDPA
jgi:hypothetical protein